MASEPEHCFTYDQTTAQRAFPRTGPEDLVMALIAGIPPLKTWEGCLVSVCQSEDDMGNSVAVCARGPSSAEVSRALCAALVRVGMDIGQAGEVATGGRMPLAQVVNRRWEQPRLVESDHEVEDVLRGIPGPSPFCASEVSSA